MCAGVQAADKTTVQALKTEMGNAACLDGNEFTEKRVKLEAEYKARPEPFKALTATSGCWEVRLICGIVTERVDRSAEIKTFLSLEAPSLHSRKTGKRIDIRGAWLATNCVELPMLLIEKAWKGNELDKWGSIMETEAYVANALGVNRVEAARPVLEEMVQQKYFEERKAGARTHQKAAHQWRIRTEAALALARLADPKSVPALITMLAEAEAKSADSSAADIAGGIAIEALVACADRSAKPLIEKKLEACQDAGVREALRCVLWEIAPETKPPPKPKRDMFAGWPARTKGLYEKARKLKDAKQFDEMHEVLKECLKTVPDDGPLDILRRIGTTYRQAGRLDEAQHVYKLHAERANDWLGWYSVATIQAGKGETNAAAASIRRAVDLGGEEACGAIKQNPRIRDLLPDE